MFFIDPMYFLFVVPALLVMFYAQSKVSSTYKKYSKMINSRGIRGSEAARIFLQANGLENVRIEGTRGKLSDHYDPQKKVLRLSQEVADVPSVAAIGIVAHEVGHAVQDKVNYAPMKIRSGLVPVANLGTHLGYLFFFIGIVFSFLGAASFGLSLIWVGIFLMLGAVLFSLVTLPVEYNASSRAREMLKSTGLVSEKEYEGASAVLSAAALTYVAATLMALANLFYFIFIAMGMSRR
jgi:hypothetical protein